MDLYSQALDDIIDLVGDRGSACDEIDVPNYLEEFIPEIISPEVVRVRMVYRGYPLPTYEFDSNLVQKETNLDINGNHIFVMYIYPTDYRQDVTKAGTLGAQGCLVSHPVLEAAVTVRFTLLGTESDSATELMAALTLLAGTVNESEITIGNITGAPRTWKLAKVQGTSQDGMVSYQALVSFQYRAATWDELVTFINPDDGKPPRDLIDGVGYCQVEVLQKANFPTDILTFAGN
jgi:hypothetical protein